MGMEVKPAPGSSHEMDVRSIMHVLKGGLLLGCCWSRWSRSCLC